jgi:hypothetical protein
MGTKRYQKYSMSWGRYQLTLIYSLFEVLKGELVNIVDYAVDHHKEFGRAPSFAVNAASWWYTNMTAKTAQQIRDSKPLAQVLSGETVLIY